MKIAYAGLEPLEGKIKYHDDVFVGLADKFQPKKLSPYYFEFIPEGYEAAQVIAIARDHLLNLLILDIEKIEARLSRTEDAAEKAVLEKCMAHLETQKPICDLPLDARERAIVNAFGLLSFKPTVVSAGPAPDVNTLCREAMDKAGMMFFYTAGKEEVHAWLVKKGSDAITCAGKIHSDLARGFIKAEVVSFEDIMTAHNMQDARAKKLTKLVDHDYVIPRASILEIRFNV
jgi:ribosome-binding ATPase YchF (GTP1/OBG family)